MNATFDSTGTTLDSSSITWDASLGVPVWTPSLITTGYYPPKLAAITGPLPYGEFFVAQGDVRAFGIDWTGNLSVYWSAGEPVALQAYACPTTPNGYAYQATQAGYSGTTEPIWPTTIGQSVTDGSVIWQCVAFSAANLYSTVASATWAAPSGVTVPGQAIAGQIVMAVIDCSAATVGTNYLVKCTTVMADGETKVGRILLKVR